MEIIQLDSSMDIASIMKITEPGLYGFMTKNNAGVPGGLPAMGGAFNLPILDPDIPTPAILEVQVFAPKYPASTGSPANPPLMIIKRTVTALYGVAVAVQTVHQSDGTTEVWGNGELNWAIYANNQ